MRKARKDSPFNVRVFSTPVCSYCITLKNYLTSHDVKFEDVDVSKDEELLNEMIEISDQMGVPVIEIYGKVVVGFDKEKVDKLLGIEKK